MNQKKGKNLKGFTLIELLAVIVILAVIALIAVPQVLKILNKARLSAAEDSVYGIVKSAETYVSNFMLKNSGTLPGEELIFNCDSDGCSLQTNLDGYDLEGLNSLEFKGTKPKSGVVAIRNNGNDIVANNLIINGFRCQSVNGEAMCFDKKEGPTSEIPTGVGYTGVKKIVYLDPTDLTKACTASNSNSDTGTKTGCMKWYAYNDDGTNYTMILDHNTTAIINDWNNRNTQLASDTTGWDSSLNSRLMTKDEILSIIDVKMFVPFGSNYGWLYDRTHISCISWGCLNNAIGNGISGMIGYWLDTFHYSDISYNIYYHGLLNNASMTVGGFGVRPVVTVNKSYIS